MAAKKTTNTTKTTKKTTTRKAAPKVEETAAAADVESILERIQAGFKEAGEALAESGAIMGDKRRDILMTLIENAQENTDATFEALRDVMDADTVRDSLRIQRDALREGIERNVAQVRTVASMTATSSRESIEPVTEYFSALRDRVRNGASA